MFKHCPRCDQIKDLSLFYKSGTLKMGVQVYCKECQNATDKKAREHRKTHGPTVYRDSKICNICKNKKPISQFGKRSDAADGKLSYCKPCWNEYVKRAQRKMI